MGAPRPLGPPQLPFGAFWNGPRRHMGPWATCGRDWNGHTGPGAGLVWPHRYRARDQWTGPRARDQWVDRAQAGTSGHGPGGDQLTGPRGPVDMSPGPWDQRTKAQGLGPAPRTIL